MEKVMEFHPIAATDSSYTSESAHESHDTWMGVKIRSGEKLEKRLKR